MSWLSDASANRINKAYINNFFDLSGNFKVRSAEFVTVDTGPVGWTQLGSDIDGEFAGDFAGQSISLSSDGTILAHGATKNDDAGADAGHARVYQYANSTWTQLGGDIDGEAAGDNFGNKVSLSSDGTILAVAGLMNAGNGYRSGHVRVYQYANSIWTQLGSDIDGEAVDDWSGYGLSLSSDGSIVAIGALFNDGNGSNAGHVRVYQYANSTWTQLGSDIDGEAAGDQSGINVSLNSDGSIVAIGANYNDGTGSNAGHVRVYEYSGGSWSQLGSDIDGEAADDNSGFYVALNGDGSIVAISAVKNDGTGSNAGHVRVYEYANSMWSQLGSDIDGETAGDQFGNQISLSSDGTIIAIGSRYNDGNGTDAGHVRVYQYVNSTWTQIGSDIDGEAAGDNFGYSVSLSSDGTIVAGSAFKNDANGTDSGHVRVYQKTGGLVTTTASTTDVTLDITNSTITMIDEKVIPGDSYTIASTGGITRESDRSARVSFSTDGNVMAVGHQLGHNSSGDRNGTATVWEYVGNNSWAQKGSLLEISAAEYGRFQGSLGSTLAGDAWLSSDGNRVMVAWYTQDTNEKTGLLRVYDYVNGDWQQVGNDIVGGNNDLIRNPNMSKDGTVISYLSMNAEYVKFVRYNSTTNTWDVFSNQTNYESLLVLNGDGTIRADINLYDASDYSLKVYKYENNAWNQLGQSLNSTESNEYFIPYYMNYDGNILVAGDRKSYGNTGVVRAYEYNSGTSQWVQLGSDITGVFPYREHSFPTDVEISDEGNVLILSDYLALDQESTRIHNQGGFAVFAYIDDDWSQIYLAYGSYSAAQAGLAVAMSGDGTRFAWGSSSNPSPVNTFSLTRSTTTQPKTMVIEESKSVTNGTSWINRGQSGGTVSESYQKGLIIESSSSSANDAVLHVETSGQTQAFSIRGDGVLYADNTLQYSSDDRRKIEEQYITNATETIQKLSPQIYTKLNKFVENGGIPTKTESGLIAQEVYYNAPELVHLVNIEDSKLGKIYMPRKYDLSGNDIQQDPDYSALGWGDKSATMDYIGLIPYLIKSNQEQDALIKARQTSIDEQAQLIQQFQERVVALENK